MNCRRCDYNWVCSICFRKERKEVRAEEEFKKYKEGYYKLADEQEKKCGLWKKIKEKTSS